MNLTDMSLVNFVNALSARESVPGGGSAAAAAGAMGIGLLIMIARFAADTEKYKPIIEALEDEKNNLILLVNRDSEAFRAVMDAYKLPKNTEEEKKVREEKIQASLREAADVPYDTLRTAASAIKYMEILEADCKKNMISDLGAGATFLRSAIESAYLNVLINAGLIRDREFAEALLKDATSIKIGSIKVLDKIFKRVEESLGSSS
jgi:formiminotetrahydrofolate cyclodeaminase